LGALSPPAGTVPAPPIGALPPDSLPQHDLLDRPVVPGERKAQTHRSGVPPSVRPSVLWDIYSKQVMRRQRRRCEQTQLFTTSSTTRSDGGVFSTVITNSRGADRQQQAIKRRTECASSTTLLNVHHLTGSLLSPEISYNRPTNSSAPTYLLTLPSPAPPRLRDSNLVYSEFALFHVTFGYVLYPYTVKTAEVDSTGT